MSALFLKVMLGMVICMPFLTSGNKSKFKRLERLEDRLGVVEARQDLASITTREDIEGLTLRLDDVETVLNNSLTDQTGCQSNPDVELSQELVTKEMLIMRRAFAEEKARLRRNTSELEMRITDTKTEMHSIMNTSDTEVNHAVERLENTITNIQESLNKFMEQSERNATLAAERLDNTITHIQDSLNTFMEQSERNATLAAERLDKLENSMNALENNTLEKLNDTFHEDDTLKRTEKIKDSIDLDTDLQTQYASCLDLYNGGERTSGVYSIYPAPGKPVLKVFCDMTTDGGGWTVFQRRKDGSVDFYRGWDEYAAGFGDLQGEFWLGNEHLSMMTKQCCHELRIDLGDFEENTVYAKYNRFQILPNTHNYRLKISGYSGTAGDSLKNHAGRDFTTKDRDNDLLRGSNCAQIGKGAWWYYGCSRSNLNGEYLKGRHTASAYEGVHWYHWKNTHKYSLKTTEMKFRATN